MQFAPAVCCPALACGEPQAGQVAAREGFLLGPAPALDSCLGLPCLHTRWELFTSAPAARRLGYRDVVVPGPMLAAFMEQFVRRELPGWPLERLSATFRVPTITGDTIVLRGVITERHEPTDGERIVCDLLIEHSDGERAVTGTATVRQPAGA